MSRYALVNLAGPLLALDTASPTVSVAVGYGDQLQALQSIEIERSSGRLVGLIDEALSAAGVTVRKLSGIVALAGPGSFTGLRVGMATALGLHQALGIAATAVPTHFALAEWLRRHRPGVPRCLAVVDALRGQWFVQPFAIAGEVHAEDPPRRESSEELAARRSASAIVGFGAERLADDLDIHPAVAVQPDALAPAALSLVAAPEANWDPATLTSPLYLRRPAVTLPAAAPPASNPATADPEPTVGVARPEHLVAVAELEAACFSEPWTQRQLASEIARGDERALVAVAAGEVVGYLLHRIAADQAELLRIAVRSGRRRRRVASRLLDALCERLRIAGVRSLFLEVRATNTAAIALYRRLGFDLVGRRPEYYANGDDALLYRFEVGAAPTPEEVARRRDRC